MTVWMLMLRHEQRMLLPLPIKMWKTTDRLRTFPLLQGCAVDVAKAVVACALVLEV